jgi:beta-glucanase (GH16 family)
MRFLIALIVWAIPLRCGGKVVMEASTPAGYTLVWSDEFNSGTTPDSSKWTYDIGGNGWGNHELQYYTRRLENAKVDGGNLVITARQETYTGAGGVTMNYSSARLKTQGLFSQTYGRFEARIKLPAGRGIWPAFWMLGDNIANDGWPKCGEIDIMENVGTEPATNHGSLHGPSSTDSTSDRTATVSLPAPADSPVRQRLSDDFHIYAAEWEPGVVRFFLDSNLYATFTLAEWPAGGTWVFDHPFFIVLNVAVGGDWPGAPDATTVFPQTMLVDYVRVYKKQDVSAVAK